MTEQEDFAKAYKAYEKAITHDDNQAIFRTEAYNYTSDTSSITSRNSPRCYSTSYGMSSDTRMESIIFDCMEAYDEEPIVSNIVDLMSDFGSQGVRIVCSDKRQEKFGQQWFEYIHGVERCERFISTLLRTGTVIVKRTDGKVPLKTQKKWKSSVSAVEGGPDKEVIKIEEFDRGKAIIPLKWTFHDPRQVAMVGGMLANFVGKPIFALRINQQLRNEIFSLTKVSEDNAEYKTFRDLIPDYVWEAINKKAMFFPLDQSKVSAYYYKKDDWDSWGKPLVRPILRDLKILNKLKACDSASLDGAMSSVRIWTIGDLSKGVVPGKAALDKLRSIIADFKPGGTTDVVWGSDLKLIESKSNLYEFLKPEKYTATLSSIYAGLGVPPGLTGSSGSSSFTNNNISLKTLIERLKYVRAILTDFLNEQLSMVQKAMGFTKRFEVEFDQMVLSDEAAEKALLLQLWDRDLACDEAVRFAFNMDHQEVEEAKINRGNRRRGKNLPNKASPYHNPEKEHDLKKLAVQKGSVTPSEIGLQLLDKKPGEKTFFEGSTPKDKIKKPVGTPLTGRPKNSKDKVKRKTKRVLPRGSSAEFKDLFRFAESAQQKVEELINPAFLAMADKKNIRSLSNEDTQLLENLKIRIFSNIQPYSTIDNDQIQQISKANMGLDEEFYHIYSQNVYTQIEKYGRALTINEKRNILCETYAEIFCE